MRRGTHPGRLKHPARGRLLTFSAALTAAAVLATSCVVWFSQTAAAQATQGTVSELDAAGTGGAWQSVDAGPLHEQVPLSADQPVSVDPSGHGGAEPEAVSWFVQVTATAGSTASELTLRTDAESGTPVLRVAAGETASTSLLLRTDGKTPPELVASAPVTVTVTPFAYLTPPTLGSGRPSPGGGIAITPRPLIDSASGLGGFVAGETDIELSPVGLGEIPSEDVAAVWLIVTAEGEGTVRAAHEHVGEDGSSAELLTVSGIARTTLTLATLSEHGTVVFSADSGVTGLRVTALGWVASQTMALDATTIPGGLQPVSATATQPTGSGTSWSLDEGTAAPRGMLALYAVYATATAEGQLRGDSAGERSTGAAIELGASPTSVPVNGIGSALVVTEGPLETPALSADPEAVLLGFFPVVDEASSQTYGPPSVRIDSPKNQASITLGESHAMFRVEGRVLQQEAGVRSLTLSTAGKMIGQAHLRSEPEGLRWWLDTSAPAGTHTLTATVTDSLGATATAEVTIVVHAPRVGDQIAAHELVVMDAQSLRSVVALEPDRLVLSASSPARVGQILAAPASETTPEGLLRRVHSVERTAEGVVLTTEQATLTEALIQADYAVEDLSLGRVIPFDELSAPPASPEIDPASFSGGGPGTVFPAALRTPGAEPVAAVAASAPSGPVAQSGQRPAITAQIEGSFLEPIAAAEVSVTATISGSAAAKKQTGPKKSKATAKAQGEVRVSVTMDLLDVDGTRTEASESETASGESSRTSTEKREPTPGDTTKTKVAGSGAIDATGTATLRTEISVSVVVKVELRLSWVRSHAELTVFEHTVDQHESSTVDVAAHGELDFEASRTSTHKKSFDELMKLEKPHRFRIGSVQFFIGAVPVSLSFSFQPTLDFSVHAEGQFALRLHREQHTRLGFRYADGKVRQIDEVTRTVEPAQPEWGINATAELALAGTLEIKAYEIVGVFFGPKLTTAVTGSLANTAGEGEQKRVADTVNASLRVDIFLDFTVGARLSLFDRDLWEWQHDLRVFSYTPIDLVDLPLNGDPGAPEQTGADRSGTGPGTHPANGAGNTPGGSQSGSGNRALVIVLDISGSMDGDRLDQAKETLNRVITQQPIGAELGVWTYPGGGDCDPGRYLVPVEPITGTGQVIDKIAGLSASGGTPTGEALRAVADSLTAAGHSGATVLLVSDGESNCDVPPCEVSQQLLQEGFDLTVESIGFQISDAGLDELGCIAESTGGQTHDVEDPKELWDIIEARSQATLDVSVELSDRVPLGRTPQLSVTVHNNSARDADGARLTLSATAGAVGARVWPRSSMQLGNIPAGGTVTQRFDLSLTGAEPGALDAQVLVWADNVPAVAVEASGTLLAEGTAPEGFGERLLPPGGALTGDAAGPVPAGHTLRIAGDGFAAADEPGAAGDDCAAAPGVLAGVSGWSEQRVSACAGASSADLFHENPDSGAPAQLGTDGPLPGATVLQVGAEDVGLSAVVAACTEAAGCTADSPLVLNAFRSTQTLDLSAQLIRVAEESNRPEQRAARNGSVAPVVVLAYPLPFPEDRGLTCSADIGAEQAAIGNSLFAFLNDALQRSVEQARQAGHDVSFVAGTASALRPELSACSDTPGIVIDHDGGTVSLTALGRAAIAQEVSGWSRSVAKTASAAASDENAVPDASAAAPASGDRRGTGFWEQTRFPLSGLFAPALIVEVPTSPTETVASTVVKPDQELRLRSGGFVPGTPVTATLQGRSLRVLGTVLADERGAVTLSVRVPLDASFGAGTVRVLGVADAGAAPAAVERQVAVEIGSPPPLWVASLALAGLLAVILAIVWLVQLSIRRRGVPRVGS